MRFDQGLVGVNKFLSQALPRVRRPSHYIGGEWNSAATAVGDGCVSFVLAYPDAYEVGAANLGIQILYQVLNQRHDARGERVFAPRMDMETELRAAQVPLFSLETRSPIASFDVIGFSLQHELNYTNVLNMLELAHLPLLAAERSEVFPLVCGGGPCTVNPEPLADFFDFFFLGEAEEAIHEIADVLNQAKGKQPGRSADLSSLRSRVADAPKPGLWRRGGYFGGVGQVCQKDGRAKALRYSTKTEMLLRLAQVPGVYVPRFYEARRDDAGRLLGTFPLDGRVPPLIERRTVEDLDAVSAGQRPVVPFAEAAQDHLSLEIARGCPHGCRFCQAGYTIRPYRRRSADVVAQAALDGLQSSGLEAISLLALNCPDHPDLDRIVSLLGPSLAAQRVALSFPSSRVDSFPLGFAAAAAGKRSGITLAPEAGSQRLRDVIRKSVSRRQLLDLAHTAYRSGWNSIKLYYMMGLPTETEEDLRAIGEEVKEVLAQAPGRARVNVSLSTFIAKPHTPFQWEAQQNVAQVEAGQRIALAHLKDKRIKVSWHDPRQSLVEGVLARGDRRLGSTLLAARRLGLKMDGWSECFDWDGWQRAFAETGIDPAEYLRPRAEDEPLPWDHLRTGLQKERLLLERHRAHAPVPAATGSESREDKPRESLPPLGQREARNAKLETRNAELFFYEVLFGKRGELRFLSSLELQGAFLRGLRRSGLPLLFSAGFHPKPRVSFGRALRVGTESDVVTAVISLTERVDSREVRARLGEALPAAMRLRAVRPLAEKGRKAVLQPDWETALVQVESAMTVGNLDGALAAFLAQPEILVVRRREGTEETFDARPEIRSLRIVEVAEKDRATSAGSSASTFRLKVRVGRGIPALAPEDLAAAFLEHLGGGRILRARQTGLGRKARAGRRKHPGEASVGPPDTGAAGQARPGGKFPEPIRAETTRGHARLEVL